MNRGSQSIERKICFSTPGNPSLTHQEVVSDVMYEPPTNKSRSLTAAIINAADNGKTASKTKITQEDGSVDYSTTHVEV